MGYTIYYQSAVCDEYIIYALPCQRLLTCTELPIIVRCDVRLSIIYYSFVMTVLNGISLFMLYSLSILS